MAGLTEADPTVAGELLEVHLDQFWDSGRPDALGLRRTRLSRLEWVVTASATRADGTADDYHLLLDGRYYDQHPVEVRFVQPPPDRDQHDDWQWPDAHPATRWWPEFSKLPSWFRLHHDYHFEDRMLGQLVCCSMTAAYYRSHHNPEPHQTWQQGRHTVAATLTRILEVLRQPYYRQPSVEPQVAGVNR